VGLRRRRDRGRPVSRHLRLAGNRRPEPVFLQGTGQARQPRRGAAPGARGQLFFSGQRGRCVLLQDGPERPAGPCHRHRHPSARARRLARGPAPGRRDAGVRQFAGRPPGGRIHGGRRQQGVGVFPGRQARSGRGAARPRQRGRFRRPRRRSRDILLVYQLRDARCHLPVRRRHRSTDALPQSEGGFRSGPVRGPAGLLYEQGRHPRAHVPGPSHGAEAGRQ